MPRPLSSSFVLVLVLGKLLKNRGRGRARSGACILRQALEPRTTTGSNRATTLASRLRRQPFRGRLKRPRAEEEIHDVAFVRLKPVQLDGRDRADVETV